MTPDRPPLLKAVRLYEKNDDGTLVGPRTFTVRGLLSRKHGAGGSSLCYEAYHANSGAGVLKEFFPADAHYLERTETGRVRVSPLYGNMEPAFRQAKAAYVEPYLRLIRLMREDAHKDLAAFIPHFEIYYDCDGTGSNVGTVYVWTPDPELATFASVCEEIRRAPTRAPEEKMITVLKAVEALSECVLRLHDAGFLHRDINPGNFGFPRRLGEPLPDAVSLFDVNCLCSQYDPPRGEIVVTEGFSEEPKSGVPYCPDIRTDLYSIGATLFYATVLTPETKKGQYRYKPEYFDRLKQLVDDSALVSASENNAHPKLRYLLTRILTGCLAPREDPNKYACCEELLKDLREALFYALPSDIARKNQAGERWVLLDVERSLSGAQEKGSMLAIQYHLYNRPLYEALPPEDDTLDVLLLGFGCFGQFFLDACLPLGQMKEKRLRVRVCSDFAADREIYLADRPELMNFFTVDGEGSTGTDAYGAIDFLPTRLSELEPKENRGTVESILRAHYPRRGPNYIFIALGNDALNRSTAADCRAAADALGFPCSVHYVSEFGETAKEPPAGTVALDINRDVRSSPLHAEIERLAFNANLVWYRNLNVRFSEIRREFAKPYNHNASVANALSVKYKLFSIGIDLRTLGAEEAARLFAAHAEDRDEMIAAEHRRWVTEKICSGWTSFADPEECLDAGWRDERTKRHICIRRSRPDRLLSELYPIEGRLSKWEKPSPDDDLLDPLDRASLELHRVYARRAKELKKENLLADGGIASVRELLRGDRAAETAFYEWLSVVRELYAGRRDRFYFYVGCRNSLRDAIRGFPRETRTAIRQHLQAFETRFLPIRMSMEYRNFKLFDEALVDQIPFILTYSERSCLAVPLSFGSDAEKTEAFRNVAAATMLNPGRLVFLCLARSETDLRAIAKTLNGAEAFLRKKNLRAAAEVALICREGLRPETVPGIEKSPEARVRRVKTFFYDPAVPLSEALPPLGAFLNTLRKGADLFGLEENETRTAAELKKAGVYSAFPAYRFNAESARFEDLGGCEALSHVYASPAVSVTELLMLRENAPMQAEYPGFREDHLTLWNEFRKQPEAWCALCALLGEAARRGDSVSRFTLPEAGGKQRTAGLIRTTLPAVCCGGVNRVLADLIERGLAGRGSRATVISPDVCEVRIEDRAGQRAAFETLLADPYRLTDGSALRCRRTAGGTDVVFDDLRVAPTPLPKTDADGLVRLLGWFGDRGYINGLQITNGRVRFTYATHEVKRLLTDPDRILEIYAYHSLRNHVVNDAQAFDDVVCTGADLKNGETGAGGRALIVTRGFRAMLVICRLHEPIEKDYYLLAALGRKLGVNAACVLITLSRSRFEDRVLSDGDGDRLLTVRSAAALDRLGKTLYELTQA